MKHSLPLVAAALLVAIRLSSCHEVDDTRIPSTAVYLDLTYEKWLTYGPQYYGKGSRFIKSIAVPKDYPYTISSATGFGGVLVVCDLENNPLAYDLACPVERRPDVRISYKQGTSIAQCPDCGSEYNVCEYWGQPISGPAKSKNWGLRRLNVVPLTPGRPNDGYRITQR